MSCRKLSGLAALLVLAAGVSPALAEGPKPLPRPDSNPADHTRKVKLFVLLGHSKVLGFRRIRPKGSLKYHIHEEGRYGFLKDDEGKWTARKDVHYVHVMGQRGSHTKT